MSPVGLKYLYIWSIIKKRLMRVCFGVALCFDSQATSLWMNVQCPQFLTLQSSHPTWKHCDENDIFIIQKYS